MIRSVKGRRAAALIPILAAALWFTVTGTAQQAAPKPEEAKPAETANQPATYAGSEMCQACHEDISNAFKKSPHFVVEADKKRGWEGKACESCHGAASRHAESADAALIRNPRKLVAGQADRICLGCHVNTPRHVSRPQSAHAKNNIGCVGCHAVHKNGPHALVTRKAPEVNAQCGSCHTGQWASFQRPYGHKLTQGAMSCVDCHDPHGSVLPKSIQTFASNERGCFKCHGDKRGPFTFEHAPVKLEGCGACHEPHGSANPRMLVRQEVRLVCLECHSNLPVPNPSNLAIGVTPPALHDLRSPRFRNCTICHSKVHGSYANQDFFK
jgi:DmsE family decaheme c-type cytochrome